MTVAQIILEQLGGNKFIVMTGAKNLIGDENSLKMDLPRNKSKANRLKITLDADDTYTMTFTKYKAGGMNRRTFEFEEPSEKIIYTCSGLFFDQLQEIFTQITLMYTHL